jgi:hypothetical protein
MREVAGSSPAATTNLFLCKELLFLGLFVSGRRSSRNGYDSGLASPLRSPSSPPELLFVTELIPTKSSDGVLLL